MQDPQTKFLSETFPEQRQPWPASQREMKPVPDCGERSYQGSGRLKGRKALVTGGDSGIGRVAYQQSKKAIAEITSEQFDRTMKTNVYATFWLSQEAAAIMKPGATIINMHPATLQPWIPAFAGIRDG